MEELSRTFQTHDAVLRPPAADGIVKLPQDLGTVALRVVLTVAPGRNLLGLYDRRLRQLDNAHGFPWSAQVAGVLKYQRAHFTSCLYKT